MTNEEEIKQLKEEIRKLKILVQLGIGLAGIQHYRNDRKRWNSLNQFMIDMGLDPATFDINEDGVQYTKI